MEVEAKYILVKGYAGSVQSFKNSEVQLDRFVVRGTVAIAQGAEDPEFVSYFIANTSTGLSFAEEFPKGIKGKAFTFGSKGLTSGSLMPEYFIRQHFGQTPRDVFEWVGFSGDHSKTLALVQSGSYEVGAVNFKVWRKEVDAAKVQVIWRTPTYPDYNWTIRGDADKTYGTGLIKKVQQALIDIQDRSILDACPRSRFIPADNSMCKPIFRYGY